MTITECLRTGFGIVHTFTKTGYNHTAVGIDNEDSIAIHYIPEQGLSIALADGVSSCKYAKEGSIYAIEVVSELLDRIVAKKIMIDDLDEIKKYIVQQWKSKIESNWNEYGTTLNFILTVNNILLIGKIGDGSIFISVDGDHTLLMETDEFYTSQTYALGEAVFKNTITILRKEITNLSLINAVLMTDGISKEIKNGLEIEFFKYTCDLINKDDLILNEEINGWIDFLDKKNGDDKSIVILTMGGNADE